MPQATVFICLLTLITLTAALEITVCDCKAAKSRGILDIEKPHYCQPGKTNLKYTQIQTEYTLITLQKPTVTWKGYSCQQWTKTKKIIGSFWIGSFDTTYAQTTKLVDTTDCWNMVLNRKCGDQVMQSSATSSSYMATPAGEGAWYDTKIYELTNCLVEEITLRQYASEDSIESPFGMLNATPADKHFIHNHNTIVWGELKTNSSGSTTLFQGNAKIELTELSVHNNISRLIDSNRQVEISFYSIGDHSIKFIPGPVFQILGMPKTFLTFPQNTSNAIYNNFKSAVLECDRNNQSDFCTNLIKHDNWSRDKEEKQGERPTRSITSEVAFLLNNADADVEEDKRLYSLSYAWGTIRLGHPRSIALTDNKSVEVIVYLTQQSVNQSSMAMLYNQINLNDVLPEESKFEYLVDNTIRIQQTESCLTAVNNSFIHFSECEEDPQQWIVDLETNQIISVETTLCLTAIDLLGKSEMTLILLQCDKEFPTNRAQQWVFETFNSNPDVTELFPEANLEEMKEFKQEQLRAITTTINSPIFGGELNRNQGNGNIIWDMISWGLFKCLRNDKCVTHHGIGEKLTMEPCDENWASCEETLQKLSTSNDQLVQTQTAVTNCSNTLRNGQSFEYSSDFTIRAFNTNNCIKANGTMVILEKCANTSSFWATFDHTAQFMAADRTGHQKIENKRCLQLNSQGLALNVCGKDREGHKRQQFVFDHKNPYHTKKLSAANIIEWYSQKPINKKRNIFTNIPPLKDRASTKKVPPNILPPEIQPSMALPSTNQVSTPSVVNWTEIVVVEKTHTTTVTISPTNLTLTSTKTEVRENYVTKIELVTVKSAQTYTSKITVTNPASTVTQSVTIRAPEVTTSVTVTVNHHSSKASDERPPKQRVSIEPTVIKSVSSNNTDQMLNDSSKEQQKGDFILPKNIAEFDDRVQYQLDIFHEQFITKIETDHENKLAKEIRDVYCQLEVIKRNQAIGLAQTNGLLAAV